MLVRAEEARTGHTRNEREKPARTHKPNNGDGGGQRKKEWMHAWTSSSAAEEEEEEATDRSDEWLGHMHIYRQY